MSGESPFTRGQLADEIGRDGEGTAVDELLKGTFERDRSGLDAATASSEMTNSIKALKLPISHKTGITIAEIDGEVSLQEYKATFNCTNETTASPPSGVHYGHYKASCESDILSEVNHIFMTIPFRMGIPLTRRTRSLHYMIQKKSLQYINKLRIVQLYEVDFNTMLKLLMGRRLMKQGEAHGLNDHQLYGSR